MTTDESGGELANASVIASQAGTQESVYCEDLTQIGDSSLCCQTNCQDTAPQRCHRGDQVLVLGPVGRVLASGSGKILTLFVLQFLHNFFKKGNTT